MTQRDIYIAKMKVQLEVLNTAIEGWEKKANEANVEARQAYREELNKLQDQSKAASSKLDDLKAASAESWDHMVAEMEKVRDAFSHSFKYFRSQL
jgi:predicted  nucleic acid-binding Zn-ribbon protein